MLRRPINIGEFRFGSYRMLVDTEECREGLKRILSPLRLPVPPSRLFVEVLYFNG